jgi:hypothetical protein
VNPGTRRIFQRDAIRAFTKRVESRVWPRVETQPDLFNLDPAPAVPLARDGGSLVIRGGKREKLSKAQQTFNRLVRSIERLRAEIEKEKAGLDRDLQFLVANVYPLEDKIANASRECLLILGGFLNHPSLSKAARRTLKELVADQLEGMRGRFDKELEELFEKAHGKTVEEAERGAFQARLDEIRDFCELAGIHADFSRIRPDMSEEEFAREVERIDAEFVEQGKEFEKAQQAPPRRKTARERKREERERAAAELRERDLSRLYKQLAKLLHPDLEQDPARRAGKEAAMKVLTAAYGKGDLHCLLRLELEWIVKEQSDVAQLTDAKLSVYNSVLKEQVQQLEEELRGLPLHPRYEPLVSREPMLPMTGVFNFDEYIKDFEILLEDLQVLLGRLRSKNVLAEVKALIGGFRAASRRRDRRSKEGFDLLF